ncbi:uncharacterized protein [Linepithema humile]|uniref:uncharacterized protein n=1 Tax=Linepithema humile TaxID=83485 RepID=UPI00351F7D41
MADPDSDATSLQCPRHPPCKDGDFIRELIQEMVYDRCFCDPGSREFVEFDSADVEHLNISGKRDYSCELYRVTARIKFSGKTCSFPLIVKLPQKHEEFSPPGKFQNEEMFYTKMTLKYGKAEGVPKCYLSDLGRYGRPVIVLEDLVARGYAEVNHKLDEVHLKLCVKALAAFHAKGLKLKANEFAIFREFYAKLFEPDSTKVYFDNLMKRKFLMDSKGDIFSPYEDEKIKANINAMKSLDSTITDISTICHGHFTRDNVLFKHENGRPSDTKIVDWETMKYCSPAIDFGFIVFTNLPFKSSLPKVEEFCRNILRFYLNAVKDEYPEVNCEFLKQDIIAKLPYAWLFMCGNHSLTPKESNITLQILKSLGSFD